MSNDRPNIDAQKVRQTARWLHDAPLTIEQERQDSTSKALYIRDRAKTRLDEGATQDSVLAIAVAWRALCTLEGISHDPSGEWPSMNTDTTEERMQHFVDQATEAIDSAPFACKAYVSLYNEVMDLVERAVRECAERAGLQAEVIEDAPDEQEPPAEPEQLHMFGRLTHIDNG